MKIFEKIWNHTKVVYEVGEYIFGFGKTTFLKKSNFGQTILKIIYFPVFKLCGSVWHHNYHPEFSFVSFFLLKKWTFQRSCFLSQKFLFDVAWIERSCVCVTKANLRSSQVNRGWEGGVWVTQQQSPSNLDLTKASVMIIRREAREWAASCPLEFAFFFNQPLPTGHWNWLMEKLEVQRCSYALAGVSEPRDTIQTTINTRSSWKIIFKEHLTVGSKRGTFHLVKRYKKEDSWTRQI